MSVHNSLGVSLFILAVATVNISCGNDDFCGADGLRYEDLEGRVLERKASGSDIWLEENGVHPNSQNDMRMVILSDSSIKISYEKEGKEIEEIYRVTQKHIRGQP